MRKRLSQSQVYLPPFKIHFWNHLSRKSLLPHRSSCSTRRENDIYPERGSGQIESLWSTRNFVCARLQEIHQWERVLQLSRKDLDIRSYNQQTMEKISNLIVAMCDNWEVLFNLRKCLERKEQSVRECVRTTKHGKLMTRSLSWLQLMELPWTTNC